MGFRGIFPVLQTPLTKNNELDISSLKKEVDFCIQAGAHGLVFPVLGSEFQFLAKEERKQAVEVVVTQSRGRIPVVAGVAGSKKADAVEYTRHAAKAGADAVIALPPDDKNEIRDYYKAIADASDCPVFIQHTNPDMDVQLLLQLLDEIENISYVKEEMHPSAHQISALLRKIGDSCLGVFGGAHGRWMLSELHRGASGFMPAAEMTDIHVQIWNAYQLGDEVGARKIFNKLLPLINLITILGLRVCKEVLVMRGVFECSATRMPGSIELDSDDIRELEIIVEDLKPLFNA